MPATTVGQETAYAEPHRVKAYVYIAQPQVVFQATIATGQLTAKTVTQVIWNAISSGAAANIKPGYTLGIGSSAGKRDYGYQRIRSVDSGAKTIYVGRSPLGKGRPGELYPDSTAHITVWDWADRRVWAKIPYIAPDGTQYKDETAYSASIVQPPVANAGADQLIVLDSNSDTWSVSLNALNTIAPSYATKASTSISTYLWNVGTLSITSGTTGSSAITVQGTGAGSHEVSLTVTDNAGQSHTAYVWLEARLKTQCLPVEITDETIRADGIELSFSVQADVDWSAYIPGTRVLYAQEENGGDAINGYNTKFSGWLDTEDTSFRAQITVPQRSVTFRCIDAVGCLKRLPAFPQRVKTGTGDWYSIASCNIDMFLHYFLHWHSNVLQLTNFKPSGVGSSYPLPELSSAAGNMWEQANRLAQGIRHTLTYKHGVQALRVVGDQLVLPTQAQKTTYSLPVGRTTTVVRTITASDYSSYEFTNSLFPRQHWNWEKAIVAGSDPDALNVVHSTAPSLTPGQGTGSSSFTEQLVAAPRNKGQNELNCTAGHRYAAALNPPTSAFRFELARPGWLYEPADMEWYQVTIPASAAAQRGYTLTTQRGLVTEVRNRYNWRNGSKQSTITWESEVIGTEGETYSPPQSNEAPQSYSDYNFPSLDLDFPSYEPVGTELFQLDRNLVTLGAFAFVASTGQGVFMEFANYMQSAPADYIETSLAVSGRITDAVVDPFSPKYLGTGSTINGWLSTLTGIYSWSWSSGSGISTTLRHTFSFSGSVIDVAIHTERGVQNFVVAAVNTSALTGIAYSTNGTTFTQRTVNATASSAGFIQQSYVSPHEAGVCYVTTRDASGNLSILKILGHGSGAVENFFTSLGTRIFGNGTAFYFPFAAEDQWFYYTQRDGFVSGKIYRSDKVGQLALSANQNVIHLTRRGMHAMDTDAESLAVVCNAIGTPASIIAYTDNGFANDAYETSVIPNAAPGDFFANVFRAEKNLMHVWGDEGIGTLQPQYLSRSTLNENSNRHILNIVGL